MIEIWWIFLINLQFVEILTVQLVIITDHRLVVSMYYVVSTDDNRKKSF